MSQRDVVTSLNIRANHVSVCKSRPYRRKKQWGVSMILENVGFYI